MFRRRFLLGATLAIAVALVEPAAVASVSTVDRWWGADRYVTAAAISAHTATAPVPIVFIATGAGFPDALAAGAAAVKLGGPVLLVTRDTIPPATAPELSRLTATKIVIVGERCSWPRAEPARYSLRVREAGGTETTFALCEEHRLRVEYVYGM